MAIQLDKQVLLDFGRLSVRLHWVYLAISVPALFLSRSFGLLEEATPLLLLIFFTLAAVNLIVWGVLRQWRYRDLRTVSQQSVNRVRQVSMFTDIILLVGLIRASGGIESPLFPLFLLVFVFLGLTTSIRERTAAFLIAVVLLSLVVVGEFTGFLAHYHITEGEGPSYYQDAVYVVSNLAVWIGLLAGSLFFIGLVQRVLEGRDAQIERNREELERVKAFQDEVLEQLPVGVVVFGQGGQIEGVNEVARDILEFGHDTHRNLLRLRSISKSGLLPYIEQLISGQTLELTDFPYESPKLGERMWFKLTGIPPAQGQNGILVFDDTTEAKRREDSEREIQDRLSQADKFTSLGQMASGVAHELNNPLTAILGTTQFIQYMLRENKLDPDVVREKLSDILLHGQRIEQLVRGLATYAKPGTGEHSKVQVGEVVEELLGFSAFELRRGNITLHHDVGTVSDFLCSKIDLQQLILNLLSNARQSFGESDGEIHLSVHERPGEPASLLIQVRDNGPGIPNDELTRIFEPFFTTKGEKGTGLGLAIVQALVERYGGKIHVESAVGQGTTFVIDLPYQDELGAWDPVGDQTFSPYR